MDTWFTFFLKKNASPFLALKELKPCRLKYESIQKDLESGITSILAVAEESLFPEKWKQIESYTKLPKEIDWTDQWTSFSPYFKEGICQIPLSDFSDSEETLFLIPGPGFGDLSHPTTFLCLSLLSNYVKEKTVLDLGCGSGVLGLAALKIGANYLYALDIDPLALFHTKENSTLNKVDQKVFVGDALPQKIEQKPTVLLLNMIFSEQKKALSSLCLENFSLWIVSGILEEEKTPYLSWTESIGLKPLSLSRKEGWIGLVLEKKS